MFQVFSSCFVLLIEFKGPCYSQEFDCGVVGDDTCIPTFQRCNGIIECPNSLDESNCSAPCNTFAQFDCLDGTCIPQVAVCDGVDHCSTQIDEVGCLGESSRPLQKLADGPPNVRLSCFGLSVFNCFESFFELSVIISDS